MFYLTTGLDEENSNSPITHQFRIFVPAKITKVLFRLARNGQREVTILGPDLQVRSMHVDHNSSIGAGRSGLRIVAQGVLVACDLRDLGVGMLDRLPVKLSRQFASGIDYEFGQDVPVSHSRYADAVQLVINRIGGGIHTQCINRNVVGKQDFAYLVIICCAAGFVTVADYEDDAPANFVTPA